MSKTITGTCHFVSYADAKKAYCSDTDRALKEGAIFIGKPEVKPGQTLGIISSEGRYCFIE